MARMATYECRKCGTKVVVTETHAANLQPIYCCGMEVAEVDTVRRQLAVKSTKKEKGKDEKTVRREAKEKEKASAGTKTSPKKKV